MLHVYNTLTRKKEEFIPLHPPFVGIYVCGPTVYDDPHLGHAKSYISFDVIVRFLRASGYKVRYVQNITDVGHLIGDSDEGEDRIIRKAHIEKLEPVEIAQKYENHYFRDMDRLNCVRPEISCRATGHIPDMIALIQALLEKGYAYEAEGNVYFDISKFPEYGKLSGRKVDELIDGIRVDSAEGKKNPADFALWKKADKQHLMQWNSPWGKGYPGWHLECSVMSMKYIGDTIDIHGGGIDNQFPHHECEIAQSEAATSQPFVRYWLHNNMVTVDGQKMSKSLGNFVTLEKLFEKYHPMTVRFFILQGHYRSPQDFSDEALDGAKKGFEKLARTVLAVRDAIKHEPIEIDQIDNRWMSYRDQFFKYMEDDFSTSGAIAVLFDMSKSALEIIDDHSRKKDLQSIERLFSYLGEEILGLTFQSVAGGVRGELERDLIELLINLRQKFRQKKEWAMADLVRDGLNKLGISIEDGKKETKWIKR